MSSFPFMLIGYWFVTFINAIIRSELQDCTEF